MPQPTRLRALAAIAAAVGILFTLLTLAPGFIVGSRPFWSAPTGDPAAGQIGWFYYARDAWRFPLFAVGNYHLPEGSFTLLSDSLPLIALIAKVVYQVFYADGSLPPIYMGAWCAACFFLQAVMASRLLSALGVARVAPHVFGVLLLCYLPLLFLRFGHFGLLAHFFFLAGLDGYVRARRGELSRRHWAAICAIPVLALVLHPYIAAMCVLLWLATVLSAWRDARLTLRGVLARGALTGAAALVAMLVGGGYFAAADAGYADYGTYSLNLLSPFVPFAGTTAGRLLHTDTPTIPGLFQWEGGCYLGAGVYLLLVFAVPTIRGWPAVLRRHGILAATTALALVFAVSHRVGFGAHEILTVPLPGAVVGALSMFRGSGRFVWIAVYLAIAFLIVATVRRHSPRTSALILGVAALLQIADTAPMQAAVRDTTSKAPASTVHRDAWERLVAQHARVFEFPSFECGGLFNADTPGGRWRALEIDWLVARAGKPVNSAYLARNIKDCDREREQAATDIRAPGTLYLYRSTADVGAALTRVGAITPQCGYLDDVVICSASADLSSFR